MLKNVFSHVKYVGIAFAVVCFMYVLAGTYLYTSKSIDTQNAKLIEPITITLADVYGSNLPSAPTQEEVDATIEGPDKNNNFIRDDVELAIHTEYANNPGLRAASLQYAQALQLLLTKVGGEETMRVVLYKLSDGSLCISNQFPGFTPEEKTILDSTTVDTPQTSRIYLREQQWWEEKDQFVESQYMNKATRIEREKEIYSKYMTSAGSSQKSCTLDI